MSKHMEVVVRSTAQPRRDAALKGESPVLVGASKVMRDLLVTLDKFAKTSAPVLITGESGTGKEVVARTIHERSGVKDGPFIPINCGGLPADLIASELFGYEKGAFTGATQRKIGRIEAAAGGTVFLDEIGDLPIELQPHLLRFLQEGTIDRVGSSRPTPVNVRVIAATNVDLQKAVADGKFREDLYYRLEVLTLHLPPLRERGDDLDLLAKFFIDKFGAELGGGFRLSDDALMAIRSYDWPGNIRELISRIRRGVVLAEDREVRADDLGVPSGGEDDDFAADGDREVAASARVAEKDDAATNLKDSMSAYERGLIRSALDQEENNVTRAAAALGVSRVTLYRLMEKHNLQPSNGFVD